MKNLRSVLNQQLTKLLKAAVIVYRLFFAQFFGGACRFSPTCSCYAQEALEKHKPSYALKLIVKRISKCHPLGPFGDDPVPEKKENCYE